MTAASKSTYTQDVEFSSSFGALQAPAHLYTSAALNDLSAPRVDQPFRYLDLACGDGMTLAMLADAHPHAEFVGIDINPAHVTRAKERAIAAGLTNVSYFEGDVMTLKASDYEPFDYASAVGVYSWLDAPRRQALRSFVANVLRPGGLTYIVYSAQPGMSQIGPLYRYLSEISKVFPGTSAEKLEAAANYAETLRTSKIGFFDSNPLAASRLKNILTGSAKDEAHEVLNLEGNGFWSFDVITEMADDGLNFISSSSLHHSLSSLVARPGPVEGASDMPVALQQMQFDIAWNTGVRRDIYIKGNPQNAVAPMIENLKDQALFHTTGALSEKHRASLKKPFPEYDFCSANASQFAEAAITAPTFGALFSTLRSQGMSDDAISNCTKHFLAARVISLAAGPSAEPNQPGNIAMTSELNQMLLDDDLSLQTKGPLPFVSPVVGTRVMLPLKDRIYLRALSGAALSDIWKKLGPLQNMFRDNEKPISEAQFVEIIRQSLPAFREKAIPELLRMRIVKVTG